MSSYTRMVLVHPDMVKSETETSKPAVATTSGTPLSSQVEYYDTQLAREKLSPQSSLISVLVHLQKKANSVLHDPSLTTSSKLTQYNQLMTRSSILMKKAKSLNDVVPLVNYPPFNRSDSDSSEEEEDTFHDAVSGVPNLQRPVPQPRVTAFKASEEGLDAEITKRIPMSYQRNARKLYRLLAKEGRGALNWNSQGELVIANKTLPGTDIVDLLADASRPKSKGRVPLGRALFTKIVKTINPKLSHVKNRSVFETPLSKARSDKKLKKKAQTGSSLNRNIIWRTRL